MTYIFIPIIVQITLFFIFYLFYRIKIKEDAKLQGYDKYRVKAAASVKFFFLGFMILCSFFSIASIIYYICYNENLTLEALLIIQIISLLFFTIGFLGYAISILNYLIVDEKMIVIVKGFKKSTIKIEDIKYFSYSEARYGTLVAYDINYIPLFEKVTHLCVGISKLKDTFLKMNIQMLKAKDININNLEYKKYKKQHNIKVLKYVFLGIGLACLLLHVVLRIVIKCENFVDYDMNVVTVEKFTKEKKALLLQFKGDNKEYKVSNIIYENLDLSIYDVLEKGTTMNIVLYNKDSKYISQIEINGKIYLDKEKSKKLEIDNYNSFNITTVILLILTFTFIIASICLFIYQYIYFKNNKLS